MQGQQLTYTTKAMTKEQFFYAYKELALAHECHLLLESGRGGKLCMAGIDPLVTLRTLEGDKLQLIWRDGTEEVREGEPLELLTEFVESYEVDRIPELPEFQGGVTGFISYDYVRRYENIPTDAEDDLGTPDLFFYLFDRWAVLDIEKETAYFMTLPGCGLEPVELESEWSTVVSVGMEKQTFMPGVALEIPVAQEDLEVSVTGPQFEQMVRDVQTYIANGEVIQVNLSVRQSKQLTTHPLDMYEAHRSFNPSPYMASIGSPEFSVVSGSPELLLKKRGDELSTRPIGGTRPRGMSESEDLALRAELLSNEKEKGEHIMLVDLEREDLERVCAPGTVETNEFMVVEKYSHVMHLVSNVRGTAAEGISNADIVKGVFPGGTITGAPKLRTMEIIEELEPTRRGLYTGSIGWFGFNGDFELNVVIRTAFIQDGIAHIQAGAGLVADSVPAAEYIESLNKAKALWQAKAMAENLTCGK
ncbi:anthranilate synthase component I family protein [Sporosarcina limicola]|uniref:Para-aminobenzoate synthetase component 1 n=1 Tax=Sporosarcina limicola TaxID=34101 RepID=A0A927MRH8_9BACL|nr:anthranilate synthase component I family protein [Sporosarcina limicola]MBE1556149.1 para-aminobenzoate synthetase component 1 [Sporosarcina limicola]